MPENKTVKNRVLCLAMCVFTLFCFYSVCPAGEKKSEEDMSDAERLHRALQKGLKNGELSPKTKTGSDTEGARYTPDKADKIINALIAKNLADTQIMIQAWIKPETARNALLLLKFTAPRLPPSCQEWGKPKWGRQAKIVEPFIFKDGP